MVFLMTIHVRVMLFDVHGVLDLAPGGHLSGSSHNQHEQGP